MSDFVEQCLQEWKRLGVPDPLAEEMAADRRPRTEEAEAEGAPPTSSSGAAFDPRSSRPRQPSGRAEPPAEDAVADRCPVAFTA